MGKPWGRLYGGTRNHRKIKLLREKFPEHWLAWYVLIEMAIECDDEGWVYISQGKPYSDKQMANEIGFRYQKTVRKFLESCEEIGLIHRRGGGDEGGREAGESGDRVATASGDFGEFCLTSYRERNYQSDSSTLRVQKYREKQKVTENPEKKVKRFRNVSETDQNRTDTEQIKEPPIVPHEGDNGFGVFWVSYPKKIGKKAARTAWRKAKDKPPLKKIIDALIVQKKSAKWLENDGQYIPNPATWINQGRWDDEILIESQKSNDIDNYCKRHWLKLPCPKCQEAQNAHSSPGTT